MLKFESIRLENFLVYKDASFVFDDAYDVFVVRAENGSGKTTFLRAMEWAIYGDDVLYGRNKYRLHPLDHDMPDSGDVTVKVEVDVTILDADAERRATITRTSEVLAVDDGWTREPSKAAFTWADGSPGERDELETRLPWRLREFFFTDGDKATDYVGGIEDNEKAGSSDAGASTNSTGNVSAAVRSLLGLDLIDAVRDNAESRLKSIDQDLAQSSGSEALAKASNEQEAAKALAERLRADLEGAEEDLKSIEATLESQERERDKLLQQGDPDVLEQQLAKAERDLDRARRALTVAERAEAETLQSFHLTYSAGLPVLADYVTSTEQLVEDGVVPASYLWWVRKRLQDGTCMCGYSLDAHGSASDQKRHAHVTELLDRSEQESKAANHAGDLYYHLHSQLSALREGSWLDELSETKLTQDRARTAIVDLEDEITQLQPKLQLLAGSPVAKLREAIGRTRAQHNRLVETIGGLEREVEDAGKEVVAATRRLDAARRKAQTAGDLEVKAALYRDAVEVLKATKSTRTAADIDKLSERMNELFKEMIVNLENLAEVRVERRKRDYEVVGIGMDGERMSVPHQFNGASKRALTNAFVVALGETAGVRAPNVIDTPLGMMDPSVRRAVFSVMTEECSQLIMLLTRSEIQGIEELLDDVRVVTVTSQGSGNLVNRSHGDMRSVVCSCNHRQYCDICEREGDAQSPLTERPT